MTTPQTTIMTPTTPAPPIINTPGGPAQSLGPRSTYGFSPAASPSTFPASPAPGSPRHQSGTIDVDTLLRNHGGDLRRTLDAVVHERNSLQSQNTQLWKLIEKQRAQCAHLAADNDRLRSDREKANSRLEGAGLEPVHQPGGRRVGGVPQSQSNMTLNSEPRRAGSDSEESKQPASTATSTITPATNRLGSADSNTSLAPSALPPPTEHEASHSNLIPSPMPERRLRHESRMTFPPEVASFMALAEGPKEATLPTTLSPSTSSTVGSELSPFTSSPGESGRASPIFEQAEELATAEPRPSQDTVISARPSVTAVVEPRTSTDSTAMSIVGATVVPQPPAPAGDHTHLTPALLPHARLSIPHSTVFPNKSGRDVLCFIVAVTARPPNAQPLSWTVGKTFSAFMDLDSRTQERAGKSRKDWKRMVSPLPEGKAWRDFAPSKIDQRKSALEKYLESLLVAPISDKTDLCNFLSTDVVTAKMNKNRKEGYLTTKGKKNRLGNYPWKTRYFVLEGPVMKYYDTRGGALLGSIQLSGGQIAVQTKSDSDARHAFLILEAATKKDAKQQHVLCASSDMERDAWIEVLVRQLEPTPSQLPPQIQPQIFNDNNDTNNVNADDDQRRNSAIRRPSKDVVVTSAQPISSLHDANAKFFSGAPSPSVINQMESQRNHPDQASPPQHQFAGPSNPQHQGPPLSKITSADTVGPLEPMGRTAKPAKRASAMPGGGKYTPAYLTKLANEGGGGVGFNVDRDRERKAKSGRFWGFGKPHEKVAARPVFGISLDDSIAIASVAGLPAIVFRCIEYLEAKGAAEEEGIYRLSGSSAVIKGLKERFNQEGDVNLLAHDERWDPHAIAGLLKTYLRELPTSLLTRELHGRFLKTFDLVDQNARTAEHARLVAELPPANYALLRAFSAHLILIVRNSAVNKMTLRNIGIVFSPTLGIPAGILYELVSHFGAIFNDDAVDELTLDDPTLTSPTTLHVPEVTNGGPPAVTRTDDLTITPASVGGNRNSMLYHAAGADTMLGLSGRALDPAAEDSQSEVSIDDFESEPALSAPSSDNLSLAASTPENSNNAARRREVPRNDEVEALVHNGTG